MCKINGAKLAAARNKMNMSQRDLAKKVGVSEASIGFYENGRTNPPDERLEKICMVLKINKDDIEISDVGYNFVDNTSRVVDNYRRHNTRYSTPEETQKFILSKRKDSDEKIRAKVKNLINNSQTFAGKRYIMIDPTYINVPTWQRDTDMAKVEEIKVNFDNVKYDPIKCYNINGFLYVADGAHRVIAIIKTNEELPEEDKIEIMTEVIDCSEYKAARIFLDQQSGRKSMSINDMYRAGIKANIQAYIHFKKLFEEKNIQITAERNQLKNPIGTIRPSSAVFKMVERNTETLTSIIDLIISLNWCGIEKNAFVTRNFTALKSLYANFGEDVVKKELMNKCKGAVYYESKIFPVKSSTEIFDILSTEISK